MVNQNSYPNIFIEPNDDVLIIYSDGTQDCIINCSAVIKQKLIANRKDEFAIKEIVKQYHG